MLRISVQPHYTPKGAKQGWICSRGSKQTVHKTSAAAGKKANSELRAHFAAGGTSAEYTIFNSKGEKSSVSTYHRKSDGTITLATDAPSSSAPVAKASKGKASKGKASKGKASKGKLNSGLKAFHAFMKVQKAAGKTHAQAQAAWAARTPKAKAPKESSKAKKSSGKGKLNSGLKAFHAFMAAQKKAGKTYAQAQAAWAAHSGKTSKAKAPKAKAPKAKTSKAKTSKAKTSKAKTSKAKTSKAKAPKAKAPKAKAKASQSPLPPL